MEAAAPPAGAKGIAKSSRTLRWPLVPTPVVVAVVGLLLGSWLLPALTQQWDDRQEAGELKASIVSDIASATGRALMSAHGASTAPGGPSSAGAIPAAGTEWSIASLEIRAELQAYFGPTAADHWEFVTGFVTSTLNIAYRGPAGAAEIPDPWSSERRSPRLEKLVGQYVAGEDVLDDLVAGILTEAEGLTSDLLTTHVCGYSTTLRDLVNDLFLRGSPSC